MDRRHFLKYAGATAAVGMGLSVFGLDYLHDRSQLQGTQESQAVPVSAMDAVASFSATGSAVLGKWSADVQHGPVTWEPGVRINLQITLHLSNELMSAIKGTWLNIDGLCVLITAERDFGPDGLQHSPWNEGVSTLSNWKLVCCMSMFWCSLAGVGAVL